MIHTDGNTVVVPNIDGKIWDIEYKIIDIIRCYELNNSVTISLNNEGPCATSLGLYDLLDNLCSTKKYKKSNIIIETNNVIEQHPDYQIKKDGPLYLDSVKSFLKDFQKKDKNFDDIKHFGFFIGRSNWVRLWIASKMFKEHTNKSLMTFHYDPTSSFHKDHLGVDDLIKYGVPAREVAAAIELINHSPVLLEEQIPEYPIITPAHFNISKIYNKFFVEIVCETYCQGTTFYPTEKIWRPIAMKTPFIVQGPKNYYNNLHKMGFKTFGNWWDEGFTNDPYEYQPHEIFKVIDYISSLSREELEGLHIDMQSTLDYNYNLLLQLTSEDFVKTFNDTITQ